MVDKHTTRCLEFPNTHDGVNDSTIKIPICNRWIIHTTNVTVINNYYITKCTLEIRSESRIVEMYSSTVHGTIFDPNFGIDNPIVFTLFNQITTKKSKNILIDEG